MSNLLRSLKNMELNLYTIYNRANEMKKVIDNQILPNEPEYNMFKDDVNF